MAGERVGINTVRNEGVLFYTDFNSPTDRIKLTCHNLTSQKMHFIPLILLHRIHFLVFCWRPLFFPSIDALGTLSMSYFKNLLKIFIAFVLG